MELSADWILGGQLDFEYKKYTLLAYFQRIEQSLRQSQLFPQLPELRLHATSLRHIRATKAGLRANFPRTLKGIERESMRLEYEANHTQRAEFAVVDAIIDFSLPRFNHYIAEAEGMMELVTERTSVYPVGIVPLYLDEGYLMIARPTARQTCVYQYCAGFVQRTEPAAAIQTRHVVSYPWRIGSSMEAIKERLIKERPELPNPAAYAVESELELPIAETLLPVATTLLAAQLEKGWSA